MKHKIIDLQTGEETIVDYTPAEIAQREIDRAQTEAQIAAEKQETAEKIAARQAVLDKLGLTADEVAALLG